ncbi:hypothetical protein QW180_27125 [Vibrio sinaloensis]|nr:hypothetical protein [Vibrio sinaloensis]
MKGAYVCSDRGVPAFGHKGCSLHVQEVMRAMKNRGIQLSLFLPHRRANVALMT